MPAQPASSLEEARAITLRNATDSRLLCLPGEIRNKIYAYVFTVEYITINTHCVGELTGVQVRNSRNEERKIWEFVAPLSERLNYTMVSRQVHAETRLLLFTLNTFRLNYYALWQYFRIIPDEICAQLKTLVLESGNHPSSANLSAWKKLTALQSVKVVPLYDPITTETIQCIKEKIKMHSGKDITVVNGLTGEQV